MEILRLPSSEPQATIEVSEANTEYEYTILNLSDSSITTGAVTSDGNSEVTVSFSRHYDSDYRVVIDGTEHFFTVVRPYVDPNALASNFSEVAEYTRHEELARAIIDSVVIEGFYYKKRVIDTVGLGADYLPMWLNVKKINKLYENNILMYDSSDLENSSMLYKLTDDKTAITIDYDGQINRSEGANLILPQAMSDLWDMTFGYRGFAKTFDYTIHLEVGYNRVPSEIKRATELLIEDIKCNNLDYAGRYIKDYNTDQFKIKFDDRVFEGTGNMIVDKILSKYAKSIRIIGVL
jgi:archaellum component FlaF (FlaF/FlaG flagellin family)